MSWGTALAVNKATNIPLAKGLTDSEDIPHTISFAILYRSRIDSFSELPKEKRPPRDLWAKAYKLEQFFEDVFSSKDGKDKDYVDFDYEDVE